SNWTDGDALAFQMSSDPEVMRTLFTNRGSGGANAMIWSGTNVPYSSTDGRIVATLFRIQNDTASAITWSPSYYYSAYASWNERASVALNGNNVWSSGTFNGLGTN